MKRLFQFLFLLTAFSFTKCSQSDSAHETLSTRQPDRIEKADDSTICHSYDLSNGDTEMFYLRNGDTTSHLIGFVEKFYSNYIFLNKDKKIYKIKQYLQPVGIKERINEIVLYTPAGVLDSTNSHLLTFEDLGDSIRLRADNSKFFNKTRVLVGDSNIFDLFSWKNPDRFESKSPYMTISKSIKGRKCVFQRITTDDKGADQSGYDIYFDIENLLCRDLSKTLVCRTK